MIDDFVQPKHNAPKPDHQPATPPELPPVPDAVDVKPEPTFKAPDEVAANDPPELPMTHRSHGQGKKKHWYRPSWPPTRKQLIIGATAFVLLCAGGGAALATSQRSLKGDLTTTVYHPKKKPATPTTVPSNLTGLPVDPSVNQRPVTGVMIENSPDARPQSGLNQAGVVFEAIAEGGITRFHALFQDTTPDYIGPVRSARPYYVQWCMGFDCSIAHVGGSPEALSDIKAWGVKDLDQFANGSYYQRISSRYAPHNVYTSMAQLNAIEAKKGYGASNYTGFARKKDSPSKTPNASSINMNISGYYYNTHYDYDATTNGYKRSEGGAPHMELNKDGSQTQITPKVVIAMVMQYGLEADDHHSFYNVIGSGQAFVFQDGTVTTGTWNKSDAKSQITFKDAAGKTIKLNAGQTWLTALSAANQVTYK